MYRAPFFTPTSLRRLLIRALASAAVCVAATAAHATTTADGLSISGSPPRSVTVGQAYSFTPTTANPKKRTLSFRIADKPRWLTFSATTGHLSGTPTAADVGASPVNILIEVSDGVDVAQLDPEFGITVSAAGTSTVDKPSISGTPPTSVTAGSAYRFQPTARDPDGKTLSFSVQHKPAWATFSIATGLLEGTPTSTQTGAYDDVIISASNGKYSSALPAFDITVAGSGSKTASAVIEWVPPTENTNGSPLTDLEGVRIYYGTSASNLSHMVQISSKTQTSYTLGDLSAGTWYFGGVAYTTAGTQSTMSRVVSMNVQ
jgi:putative Ig domain-containing protein